VKFGFRGRPAGGQRPLDRRRRASATAARAWAAGPGRPRRGRSCLCAAWESSPPRRPPWSRPAGRGCRCARWCACRSARSARRRSPPSPPRRSGPAAPAPRPCGSRRCRRRRGSRRVARTVRLGEGHRELPSALFGRKAEDLPVTPPQWWMVLASTPLGGASTHWMTVLTLFWRWSATALHRRVGRSDGGRELRLMLATVRPTRPSVRGRLTMDARSRARLGAFAQHARYDTRQTTMAARQAFARRFERGGRPRWCPPRARAGPAGGGR